MPHFWRRRFSRRPMTRFVKNWKRFARNNPKQSWPQNCQRKCSHPERSAAESKDFAEVVFVSSRDSSISLGMTARMQTDLLATSAATQTGKAVGIAVELLRKGYVVALPTETVYGLAASALNAIAVTKIFEAKERPRFDPLIVHLPNREWLGKIAKLPADDRQLIFKLADSFWPGPFTMVLPKGEIVPDIVTAGLNTVAVRLSAHRVFAEIVGELDEPLAAPSANRFGRVSPTTAQHVLDELEGRIRLIIDAGPTEHGLESTIIAVLDDRIRILRRGPITAEQLSEFASVD